MCGEHGFGLWGNECGCVGNGDEGDLQYKWVL